MRASVIGAGLAGCEAAWQLAERGIHVTLTEMKPHKMTPAHHCADFAELVCSNSLRGDRLENAVGLLKEEMRRVGSLVMEAADLARVPAGGSLAVDRERFSSHITRALETHKNVRVLRREVLSLPEEPLVVASGPLTDGPLLEAIQRETGREQLSFYDAAAPIVYKDSIDMDKAFRASRYGRGEEGGDYINCPMDRAQYETFYQALMEAKTAPVHGFEDSKVFEGCMPVEVMAKRGMQTLCFGPLKPKGLTDPRTGKMPYAVLQLRQDDAADTLYNLVGFQTRLLIPEQKRVFGLIPGLEKARYARFGAMHRNTFLNSPGLLDQDFRLREGLYFAGQMTGVEGYIESAASGLVAGVCLAAELAGRPRPDFTDETVLGAMGRYISTPNRHFQPMNANFGVMAELPRRVRNKQERYAAIAQRSLDKIAALLPEL